MFKLARFLLTLLLAQSAATTWAAPPSHLAEAEEPQLNPGLGAPPPAALDCSTARRTWQAFLDVCRASRWETGAHLFNLGEVQQADQKLVGTVVARKLCAVLKRAKTVPLPSIDDSTLGPIIADKPTNYVVVATVPLAEGRGEVGVRRFKDRARQEHCWLFTRHTVSEIPRWHQLLFEPEHSVRAATEVINRGLGPLPPAYQLRTPRETVTLFAQLTSEGRFAAAAHLLNLSALPSEQQPRQGPRLARRLALVLKQLHPGGHGRLSNDPMGSPERDTTINEEVVARGKLGTGELRILLELVPRKEAPSIWLFSRSTIADVDASYAALGYGWAGDHLPPLFFTWGVGGLQLWQWLGLVVILLASLCLACGAAYVARRLLRRLTSFTRWRWDDALILGIRGPLISAFWALGFLALMPNLALAAGPRGLLVGMCKLVAILASGWFLLRVVDVASEALQTLFRSRGEELGSAMVPVARKVLKPVVIAVVVVVALQNVGMDVGGLLATLGIGGLAIALAAKDTLANLFGSIAIAFDRPFKLGDYVKIGDLQGTVEDVGLRSTKLRTLDRTVVTIPNSQLADSRVENFSRRDRMRLEKTFGLQYDTSLDQVRYIVDEAKRYLLAHPRVLQDDFTVRFIGYADSALEVQVVCYVLTSNFGEFTGIREEMLMELGELIARAGAQLAYPSQTIYVGKDSAADAKKAKLASAAVAERRAAGELCLPEIPEAVRTSQRQRGL